VKKGQMILHINDIVYKAQVQAAKAMIAQTQAELKFAKSNYERKKTLFNQKASSESTLEEAQKTYYTTLARLDNYKAQLILAEDSLSDTRVCAPFDGRIGKVILSPGNHVSPGKELVRLVTISPVNVDFSISSRDFLELFGSMEALKAKGKAYMELADGSAYPGNGRIIFMSNSVDSNTDTIEIRASFDNKDGKLIPGGLVTIRLGLLDPPKMIAVPLSAMLNSKQGSFVYVLSKDNRAVRRPVTAGAVWGNYQFIAKGLKPGETVISGGTNKVMFPGMQVKPVFAGKAER
jgi:RND family efflux transporter MFP subunit